MTEAMPFLQKAILLSYDPLPLDRAFLLLYEKCIWTKLCLLKCCQYFL